MYSYKNCYGLSLLRLSLMCTEKGIRTKIVMVYHLTVIKKVQNKPGIRTKIVMVYRKVINQQK